jgi:hypothetical protein
LAVLLVAAGFTLAGCSSGGEAHTSRGAASKAALTDLAAIQRGDCASVESRLTPDMHARLSAQAMCSGYRSYLSTFGAFVSHGAPKLTKIGADDVVQLPLHMANRDGEFRVTFDTNGHIAGMYFLRTGVPL